MSYLGPRTEQITAPTAPGFYLLDDANGRFAIDREMGIVTLTDNSILQTERNAIHGSDSQENAVKELAFFFSESDRIAAR